MERLNEALCELPAGLAKEFLGKPEKQLFPGGTKLLKRVTSHVEYNRLSVWWMLKSDWDRQKQRATAAGVKPADLVRSQQAVRNDWQSNLEQVVYGQLMQPVYGWVGKARWQPLNSCDPKVVLIGGGQQICIPNLTSLHLRVLHSVPGAK